MRGTSFRSWSRTPSLRRRLLAGVILPGLAVFGVVTVTGYQQVSEAQDRLSRAEWLLASIYGNGRYFPLILGERAASARFLAEPGPSSQEALDLARSDINRVNREDALEQDASRDIGSYVSQLPPQAQQAFAAFADAQQDLPATRAQVDALALSPQAVVRSYAPLSDVLQQGNDALSPVVGSTEIGARIVRSGTLSRIADLVDRARILAVVQLRAEDPDPVVRAEIAQVRGAYTELLDQGAELLEPQDRETVTTIRTRPNWQYFDAGIAALADPDARPDALPVPERFDVVARDLAFDLLQTGMEASRTSWLAEADDARAELVATVRNAVLLLLGLLLATAVTAVVASRAVGRLGSLRAETLELADTRLPGIVERLRGGERVDLDAEVPVLEYGADEIGQVASAFNHAQRTAVRAAVAEATLRAGFNNAFLNIARRSQGILQQQIEVLDQVQRGESDPDKLRLLFRLDHLTTRERRNAENLIILGGDQPRRRWRRPVHLRELVRGAIGESEHYQRIRVGWLPEVRVIGPAVGDLVHLLAELIDNATAFSPPGAPIEVRSTVVGRGIAIEVEDQGLGMEDARFDEVNETLRNPPDFGLLALSGDSRIGLFVVAWLARKHGMLVALRRSTYGGVLAGVLVPTQVVAVDEQPAIPPPPVFEQIPEQAWDPTPQPALSAPTWRRSERIAARETPALAAGWAPEPEPLPDPEPDPLPELPRRRRQEQLSPQLRGGAPAADEHDQPRAPAPAPTTTRSRMAALQQGSRAARQAWGPEPIHVEEQS